MTAPSSSSKFEQRFYRQARRLWRFLTFLGLFRVNIIGIERVPTKGAAIVAGNHPSEYDPGVAAWALSGIPRIDLTFLAKSTLFHQPILGWLLRKLKQIPVKLCGVPEPGAVIEAGMVVLDKERLVVLFPQGGVEKPGTAKRWKSGAACLAIMADVSIIPMALIDTRRVRVPGMFILRWAPWRRVTIIFGEPIGLSTIKHADAAVFDHRSSDQLMAALTELLRSRIEGLIATHLEGV
jgi:1-acyl-sn-glycerol-3-phosphate acyltransferase